MNSKKILIAENDSIVAKSLETNLIKAGYEIVGITLSGEEAIDIVDKMKPDIALIDIALAGKIDGIEAALFIQKNHEIPIIYLTSFSDEETLRRAQFTEPAAYLFKPFDIKELETAVQMSIYKSASENKLKESEARYKILYENNPLMIFTLDTNFKILSVNKHSSDELGYDKSELEGENILNLYSDENRKLAENKLQECLKFPNKSYSWETKFLHKDGHTIWARNVACSVADGENNILITCENITEKKIAEQNIQETNRLLQMVTDEASDLIAIVDLNGKRLYNSKSYTKILGDPEALRGTDSFKEIHPDDRDKIKKIFHDTIATGIGQLTQYRFLLKDNSVRHIESQGNIIKNAEGKPEKVLIVARDITERKQSEAKLAEYNEELKAISKSKDKLFSIIAHDLRSPFTALLGFSEYMAKYYDELTPEELKEYSTALYHSAQSIFNLLENLLQWSRMQTNKFDYDPVKFNILSTIQRVYNLFSLNAIDKNIKFTITDKAEHEVLADENCAFSIIRNLVSNAIKFTPKGGKVTIEIRKKDNLVFVSVIDTGVGISRDNIKKLFKENIHFSEEGTEKEKGTGLGLLLCKELIEKCGGNIFVESIKGEGSTFSFTLQSA